MFEFLNPLILTSLLVLPALWWLLRLLPPKPKREIFPPLKILLELPKTQETPQSTPWWLLLLRLLLVTALIFMIAGVIFTPQKTLEKSNEPLVLMIDNGALAAKNWEIITKKALELINGAENGIILAPTSDKATGILTKSEAIEKMLALSPVSFIPERNQPLPKGQVIFLSDGFSSKMDGKFAGNVAQIFKGVTDFPKIMSVEAETRGFLVTTQGQGKLIARDSKGLMIAEVPLQKDKTLLELPLDLRNQTARLEIAGERHASAIYLVDRRFRKKAATIISGASGDLSQPLLSPTYYLERALTPYAERRVVEGASASEAVMAAIKDTIPIIILTDVGRLSPQAETAMSEYIEKGGMLIRFAGTRLAGSRDDPFLPVKLRQDVRQMGGALSWDRPRKLAEFPASSPFKGLIPASEVTIQRQVLAEPDASIFDKTWAQLEDGTPIITGETRGRGALVLFHISANLGWSNLPLSGLFLQMLERLVQIAGVTDRASELELSAPLSILNGFGGFITPPSGVEAIKDLPLRASAIHHAGLYGLIESPLAVNVFSAMDKLEPLDLSLFKGKISDYSEVSLIDYRPYLLALLLILFIADCLIVLWLGGHIKKGSMKNLKPFLPLLFIFILSDAQAETQFAYVRTGKITQDTLSHAGLRGLSRFISARTTLEPGEPKAVDFEKDELALSPIIYWPVSNDTPTLSAVAKVRLETYLKTGGMLIIDTQDAHLQSPQNNLRRLLISLDLPELTPIPKDHVVTRSYYLLDQLVGRYTSGQTWIEALETAIDDERPAKASDGVSPVIITSNDFASAWAVDEKGGALVPLDSNRQREMAYRAGLNMVFYALTGNYKADQVHAPAILERLGRQK